MIINFIEYNGHVVSTDAGGQPSLMRLAAEHGVSGIIAECGGVLACATCHVVVDDDWVDRLPPPAPDEDEMLDCIEERRSGSRLSCQIRLEPSLDGLVVHVPESQF